MRYANLHTHTDYSNTRLIDSINKVPDIISLAHKLDLRALARIYQQQDKRRRMGRL